MRLYDAVSTLAGIGQVRAKQLDNLGIRTLYDLIAFFPRSYEDRTKFVRIDQLEPDVPACFQALVISQPRTAHIRKGMDMTRLTVSDNTGRLNLVFFNQGYVADQLHYGEEYCFFGRLDGDFAGYQMANPKFEPLQAAGQVTRRILPVYNLTAGISNQLMVRIVAQALDACRGQLPEILPETIRRSYGLCDVATAYDAIHQPESFEALEQAKKRLIFEEFFIFSIGLSTLRARRNVLAHAPYETRDAKPYLQTLPFSPTGAQLRAIGDILDDFGKHEPMNRLVQGDVGSGKTVVAAAAAYVAASNGRQTALMAPTEILAEQHHRSITPLLAQLGVRTALLTGSLGAAAKRSVKAEIASGQVQLVIGTHALLTGDVDFKDLDLVIADEQHRFGVAQRAQLSGKGENPHLLVMSATPIPRTLSLILYGDLDLSVMDELPPGRQSIDTFLVDERYRARMNAFIRKQTDAGHQVYIVCPAIEESEEESLKSAEQWADALQKSVFPDLSVALLHGRMKGAEKDAVMSAFAAGQTQILVCTTVIEVGVDVPNATLIVIENAERFGLSQLHQLRGRVGRGTDKSYCVLFSDHKAEQTRARLKVLCETGDGFRIAEEDLTLRGPGDFFGSRQHGLPLFKVANLTCDLATLEDARSAAADYLAAPPSPDSAAHQALFARISALFREDLVLN